MFLMFVDIKTWSRFKTEQLMQKSSQRFLLDHINITNKHSVNMAIQTKNVEKWLPELLVCWNFTSFKFGCSQFFDDGCLRLFNIIESDVGFF